MTSSYLLTPAMNDIGLEDAIQITEDVVEKSIPKHDEAAPVETEENASHRDNSPKPLIEKGLPELDKSRSQIPGKRRKHRGHKRTRKQYDEQDEEESSIYQPTYGPRRSC